MLFIATILNLIASYFIACVGGSLLIIPLAFFALVILNIEILSLFSAINAISIPIFSLFNAIIAFIVFKKMNSSIIKPKFDFKKLKNALLLDKSLIILGLCFISFLGVSFFIACAMPPLEPDSQTYHFFRAWMFYKNHSLIHFDTNDIRAIIMPINSEILYCWILTLSNKLNGFGLVSFFSYITAIFSIASIGKAFKLSYRKILFSIFLLSSLSAVIVQVSSLQSDCLVGCLFLLAFALYIKKIPYFSSLALAIALGVKSTGFIGLIGFIVLILMYEGFISDDYFKKNRLIKFFSYLILNFIIFSSYNYILNFIQFKGLFSNRAAYLGHKFWGGISGFISNLINYFFQFFDFTGFKWGFYLNDKIFAIKKLIYAFLNINPIIGVNVSQNIVNIGTDEQTTGFGILGFLAFLPSLIKSLFCFKKNRKNKLYFILGTTFIINIIVLSLSIAYMIYSIRFIVAFIMLSSLVFASIYSKKGNIYKGLIILFSIFYMTIIPYFIVRAPFFNILSTLKENNFNLDNFNKACFEGRVIEVSPMAYDIKGFLDKNYPDIKKIGYFKGLSSVIFYLKTLPQRNIDFLVGANYSSYILQDYDLVIFEGSLQNDNIFNIKDIDINYDIKGYNVLFHDKTEVNCFYKDVMGDVTKNLMAASERECFTKDYMMKNRNFKLDKIQEIDLDKNRRYKSKIKNKVKLYYFTKLN